MRRTKVIAIAATIETSCWYLTSGMLLSAAALFYATMIY
jgi:hypothetical protein